MVASSREIENNKTVQRDHANSEEEKRAAKVAASEALAASSPIKIKPK